MPDDTENDGREMLVPLNVRTYKFAVANGIFAMAAFRVADRSTVVPLLIHKLSGAAWMVGLVLALWRVVRTLVQVFAARRLDARDHKKPYYIFSAFMRGGMFAAIAVALWFGQSISNTLLLLIVIVGLMGHSGGGAVASLSFNDILAKSIPTTRRGSLQMWRRMGALAIVLVVVTPFVRHMIGADSPFDFPRNFGVLFAVSVIGSAIGWTLFAQVREPKSRSGSRRLSMRQHLARGWQIIHNDKRYRRLIRVRLLTGLAAAVRPFFIVFATQVWGMSDEVAATFLGIQVASELLGAGVVGQISDRFGNRKAVLVAVCAMVLATVAGVTAAFGSFDIPVAFGPWTINLRTVVLGAAFVGSGLFLASLMIGYMNYMMDIAPDSQRPSYLGFSAGFTMPLALAPVVFGWAADALGYKTVFVTALILALGALYFARDLPEPRDHLDDEQLEQFRRPPTAGEDDEA